MQALLLLLGLALAAAAPGYAQEEDESWGETAWGYAEEADGWCSTGSAVSEDIEQGDVFSAITQGVISTWRSFNETYTPPGVREWVDQAWDENQQELDRQREARNSGSSWWGTERAIVPGLATFERQANSSLSPETGCRGHGMFGRSGT
jgi:hypothetical protein